MLAALAMAGSGSAKAAALQWDPLNSTDSIAGGGTGTWDATNVFWFDGATNVVWPNTAGNTDEAIFGGTAGTVTLGVPILANKLTFNVGGYTITSGATAANTLTLTGPTPTITVTNGADSETISSVIDGTAGLIKAGAGTLTLSGANIFKGGVSVNAGTLSIGADANLGDATNGVTLAGGSLSTGATFTSSRAITLGTGGGTLDVTGTGALTLSTGLVANANSLTKTGTGTLSLSTASTRTGTTAINGGTITLGNVGALGTGAATVNTGGTLAVPITAAATLATPVTLNGGTFSIPSGAFTLSVSQPLTVSAASTINITGAHPSKLLLAAGQLTGAGDITRTGSGTLQISGANSGFTGNWTLNGGVVEVGNAASLGSGSVSVNTGGELGLNAVNFSNSIKLNGGTISSNAASGASFSGPVNVAANSNVALRFFQTTTSASSFSITGALTGSGNLTVVPNTTATTPAAATLTLSGDNSGYSGKIVTANNQTVAIASRKSLGTGGFTLNGGTLQIQSLVDPTTAPTVATPGTAGLNATYYNFGSNPGTSASGFAVDQLYLTPRTSSRIDADINIPNGGAGTLPIVPVPGFAINASGGGVNDGVMWKGLLNITTGGSYQFSGINDDNFVLYIDGQQIGTLGVNSSITNIGSAITLPAGAHSIVVKQTQGTGGGYAALRYSGPDSNNTSVVIPASAFTNGSLAAVNIGPVSVTATSTVDISGPSRTTSLSLGNATLNVTSPTIDNLSVDAATITAATPTLAPTTGGLIFTGAIGQSSAGLGLNIVGPYFTEFQATNTYTGTTTLSTAGQLRLNAAGGNSIAGNLVVNAANANGAVANVRFLRNDQIADTATVTMTQGILDTNGKSDTIANLAMNGGQILGSGVLTVTNAPTLTAGYVESTLAGNWPLNKTGGGTAILAGNNTYTGLTTVSAGALNVRGTNALGAGGTGNGTTVTAGAALQLSGANVGTENITINGNGIAPLAGGALDAVSNPANDGALRHLGGASSINNLTTGSASTVRVDSGKLTINGVLDVSGGVLTKTGKGTLTFASNQSSIPAVTFNEGALGFSGPQSFGAATVPAGLAYQFESDPGSGVSLTVNSGSAIIGNYTIDQAFLSRITAASTGTLALGVDNSNNLNFSSGPNVSLGATGLVNYSGALTPNSGVYRLGGGGGKLTVSSVLSGSNGVQVNGDVQLNAANTFVGGVTIKSGKTLYVNDSSFGAVSNVITLDGGTLQIANPSDGTSAQLIAGLGNQLIGGGRIISVGAGGGTLEVVARQAVGNTAAITAVNGLTGSGALTKTGLGLLFVFNPNDYSGALTLDANSNRFDIRANGSLPNVGSITINQSAELDVDNNNGSGQRQFSLVANTNRLNDAAAITLQGGKVLFVGRNVAFAAGSGGSPATSEERFGALTAGIGQSELQVTRNGGGGADMVIANLQRAVGSGTVRFVATNNTLGQSGDNPRIILSQVNGAAPTASSFLGGWAVVNTGDFAAYGANSTVGGTANTATGVVAYGATNAPAYAALATTTAPGANGFVSGSIGSAAADVTLGTPGAAQNFVVGGLRLAGTATRQILFGNTTNADTLYVESGGILSDNSNNARNIGTTTSAATRGRLTAGTATATTPQELFLHNNQNTLTINSQIIDNPNNAAATVKVVKDLDGTVVLDSGSNSYTGGTLVLRGTLTANNTGSLGTGGVIVKNSILNLGNRGSTTGAGVASNAAVYTLSDQSQVVLQNNTNGAAGQYNAAGDRFSIDTGSSIYANSPGAGSGLNSLTRIASPTSFTSGGQVYLAPGSIVKHNLTNAADQGSGTLTIQNLGTNADLFFAPGNIGGVNQTITVGAGTPWMGLSSDRSNLAWTTGTIFANSDFTLQGLTRDNGVASLTLGLISSGTAPTQGSFSIVNNSGGPINAWLKGQVIIAEDEPISMPSNLTLVATPGSFFQPNHSNSLGSGPNQAKLLAQAGSIVDPGNYVPLGSTANQNTGALSTFQNLPYPLPSPLSTTGGVTFETGSRLLINDLSGIGSAPDGSMKFQSGSIIDLGHANAFFGRGTQPFGGPLDTTGVANPNQFVFEPGVVFRSQADNIYKFSQFVPSDQIIEIFNGSRTLTNQNNPFIIPAVGTPTIAPENVTIANGGILTNDSFDRQVSVGRGKLIIGDGAVLAGTTETYVNLQQSIEVAENATITIGSTKTIDGLPKTGGIQFVGANSNVIPASATVNMLNGTQILFSAQNVWPDSKGLDLPLAVTSFPSPGGTGLMPGNGTSLGLNTGSFIEYMGPLTGNGAVIANAANTAIAVGWGATSDFTSGVVFKSTNGQNPNFMKTGLTKMTLTGVSDSTGDIAVQQGELSLAGTGSTKGIIRVQEGATFTIDNSGTALNNRTGNASFWAASGGTINLIGNATTPVTESVQSLASGNGAFANNTQVAGVTYLNITPGVATTTLNVGSFENYVSAGQRTGTWVLRSPSMGNLPGTYGAASGYTPNAGNVTNGLIQVVTPNFASQTGTGAGAGGFILGAGGTAVAPTLPHVLGTTSATGEGTGFVTEDANFFNGTTTSGSATLTILSGTTGLAVGQTITGAGIPSGTTITAINGTSVTMSANATATGSNVPVSTPGYMRLLAASEYASYLRDNQNTSLNVKLAGTTNTSGDTRIQTLTLTPGSTVNIGGNLPFGVTGSRLMVNSGGVFVQSGGSATINGGAANNILQTVGGASLYLHSQGDLNLNATAFSDTGIVKTGSGTLNVGAGAFSVFRGTLEIDGGTVNLGGGNTFANVRAQNGFNSSNSVFLNSGTLNLNGNSQMINSLYNNNDLAGMGGTLTSNSAATLSILGGGRFSGTISGAISLDKPANNTLLLLNDNPYTGSTNLRAGQITLRDSGKLSGTSSIDVNYGTLQIDNGYLANVSNRIAPTTPITLRGGTFNLTGAAAQVASQTINSLTTAEGVNNITGNAGGNGAVELNIGNLVRPAGSGAIVNFNANYGFLGTAGNNTTAVREFITTINGTPTAQTLNDGIIGGWAVVGGTHFATYLPGTGIGALSNTADGYANYTSSDVTAATATQNVSDTSTARTLTASKTINSYRIPGSSAAAVVITLNTGVGLTIDTGGLITDNNQTVSLSAATDARGNSLTSNSGELDVWVNQNISGINVPVTGSIDFVKSGLGTLNLNPSSTITGTLTSGNKVVTLANTTGLAVGQAVSGTGIPAGTTITAIDPNTSITLSNNATAAGTSFVATFGNSYTGKTIVNGGTLTLNQAAAADATTALAIPGDLVIQGSTMVSGTATPTTVTEANVGNQISKNANVTLSGGARLNLVSAPSVTETLKSITFTDGAGVTTTANVDRTASQPSSTLLLSAPTAVIANNTNPQTGIPFFGGFLGNVGFTNATGATLQVDSPVSVNGVAAVGLRIGAAISDVPTGVAGGGLIKSGGGLLVLGPDQTVTNATNTITAGSSTIASSNTLGLTVGMPISGTGIPAGSFITSITPNTSFTISQNATTAGTNVSLTGNMVNFNKTPTTYNGTVSSLTDVFNIAQGYVRVDANAALGSNSANTTVQSGAVLLGSNTSGTVLTGSVTLKDGSTLGATINAFTMGNATTTVANQSVLNIPSGAVNIAAYDYFVPVTNAGNITVNGRLTGAGNINLVGPQLTQGNGGGGVFTLGNPILTGSGANDYIGTINVGANAILKNQVALTTGITRTTGNAIGAATVNLNGGRLQLRDDASATADVSNTTVSYGTTNVVLSDDSFLDANRQTSTTAANNIINLGTLTVLSGSRTLTVDSTNGYQIGFAQLDGPGTLVKGGGATTSANLNAILNINGYGANFSGNIAVAGPVGIAVGGASGLNLNAATNALQNLTVNGAFSAVGGKTLSIADTLAIGNNAGSVTNGTGGVSNGAVTGMVSIPNTATINFGASSVLRNDGLLGSTGGGVTLNPSKIQGSGIYQTLGQQLTLGGQLTDAGTSVTRLKVAGDSIVNLTPAVAGTSTGGAEVQSGTLRVAPTVDLTNPLGTNTAGIRVYGSPASTLGTGSQPVAAISGTLQFDSGTKSVIQDGNITNNGLVQVKSGTTTVNGIIAGTPVSFAPGLLEGRINTGTTGAGTDISSATRSANPGNFGIKLEPRMAQTNVVTNNAITGWSDQDQWVYTGQFYDADGVFTFAENIDDAVMISIDGVTRLLNNQGTNSYQTVTSTATTAGTRVNAQDVSTGSTMPNLGTPTLSFGNVDDDNNPQTGNGGWHTIEIRLRNGSGNAGPTVGNGFAANFGFGLNRNGTTALDGAVFERPIDPGDGSLFRTPVGGSGKIDVAAGATLNAQGFKLISSVALNGNDSTLQITSAGTNDTDAITATGGTSTNPNKLTLAAGAKVSAKSLAVANAGTLRVAGTTSSELSITDSAVDGTLDLDGAAVSFTGVSSGTGTVNLKSGSANVAVGGSIKGSLNVTEGSLNIEGTGVLATSGFVDGGLTQSGGSAAVNGVVVGDVAVSGGTFSGNGAILGTLTASGGILAPGSTLESGALSLQAPAKLAIEIGGAPGSASNDQLIVTGGISLAGELQGSLLNGYMPNTGDRFIIMLNDGTDAVSGTFNGLAQDSRINFGGISWIVTYTANGDGGLVGNDVALIAQVPEPASAATLIGGLGMLAGMQRFRRRRN